MLALFSCVAACHAGAQGAAYLDADSLASAGQPKAEHWLPEKLQTDSRQVWMAQRVDAGLSWQTGAFEWWAGQTRQRYLQGNGNALFLAAQNEVGQEILLPRTGTYALQAQTWSLDATAVGVRYKHTLGERIALEWSPHLLQIHDYQHSKADLSLTNDGDTQRLAGSLVRTGTRSYGYLVHDQPDAGWGAGLDFKASWQATAGAWSLQARNVLSQLRFSTVHNSTRQYQVVTQTGRLQVSNVPSLNGVYGMQTTTERLPLVWQLDWRPDPAPGLQLGWVGLETAARWRLRYELHGLGQQWWVQTVQTDNWSAGIRGAWSKYVDWNVGVSTDRRVAAPVLSTLSVRCYW